MGVELHTDLREFLSSRRARLSPEQVGLPTYRERRRVRGLRREEVASLAGVSVDYYARLERGRLAGASVEVLDAVARALRLDEAEHEHLLDLARNAGPAEARRVERRRSSRNPVAGPAVLSILHGMDGIPAYVRTTRMDILAANGLCRALYGGALDEPRLPVNLARFLFLDPHSRGLFLDWDAVADEERARPRAQ